MKLRKSKILNSAILKRTEFSKTQLLAFIVVFGLIGSYLILRSFAATPTLANLWIDTNGGSCTRSATPAVYNDAAACSSFDAANDVCQNNDLALVQAGSYTDQIVTGSNSRTSACTIQGVSSTSVNFHSLSMGGDWLTVKDMTDPSGATEHNGNTDTCDTGVCFTGNHITADNIDVLGKWAYVNFKGNNNTWKNSEMGTAGNTSPRLCGQDPEPVQMSNATNALIANNTFHAFRGEEVEANCGGNDVYHLETFRMWDSSNGVTFLSNHFDDGNGDDSFTIFSGRGGCPASECPENINVHVVNNYFGEKCCSYAAPDVGYGDGQSCVGQGWVFAYNFFHNGDGGLGNYCTSESGTIYVGNMGYNGGGCPVNGTVTGNLWIGSSHGTCAGNTWLSGGVDQWGSYNLAADGYHLTSASPSINAGETTYCNLYTGGLDIDGQTRNGNCDAGPDEFVQAVANLWIDTNGGTCTRQATPGSYNDAQACSSLNAAYQAASAGDVVFIKAGSYGSQTIADRALAIGNPVVFHPAANESVILADLTVQAHDITIDGGDTVSTGETDRITVNADANASMNLGQSDTRNIILEDMHMRNTFDTAHGLTIRYSEIGPNNICSSGIADLIDFWPNAGPSKNITLANNQIHDNNWNACSTNGDHPDALQVYPQGDTADNIVIRGNRFWHCGTQCIFLGDGTYTNTVVENNMVEETDTCVGCGTAGEVNVFSDGQVGAGDVFRYNTIEGSINLSSNFAMSGNIALTAQACGTANWVNTIFPASGGSTCGTNTKRCTPILSNGSPYSGDRNADWHIAATDTCAKDAGSPTNFPTIDIDNETRAALPDAGADEFGSAGGGGGGGDTAAPTVSLTAPANGAAVSGNAVTVSANASDDTSVSGVQFKLDGADLGSEDTTSPYSIAWNASQASNGSHSLTAIARDAAGNNATSAAVNVTVTGGTSILLGNQTVEAQADFISVQQAEAWPFTALGSGAATSVNLYLDTGSTAQGVLVGLYGDSSRSPGSLLATATISTPSNGNWNSASFASSPAISSGTTYWLGVLGTGTGQVKVRDRAGGSCTAKINALPNNWTSLHNPFGATGGNFTDCPLSAYVLATGGSSPAVPGDLTGDGHVTLLDLSILLSHYGQSATSSQGDLTGDNQVTLQDLSILLSHYGS